MCRGEKVRILDNFSTGKRSHMKSFADKVELVRGDIRNPAACARAAKGMRYVIHQAAIRRLFESNEHILDAEEVFALT